LNLANLEIVGFSLGSQLAGWIGKRVQTLSNGKYKLPKIVAIEPVLVKKFELESLKAKDADFVMTFRTETRFNDPETKGHANFYFNADLILPGCYLKNWDVCKEN
jgi:Lipase